MVDGMNKIQIRAEVFSAINLVCSSSNKKEYSLNNIITNLCKIENKDFLAKLLIKEFISANDTHRESVISLFLIKCIPVEILENNLWSNLSLKTVSDEKKYQLVDVLKSMGKFIEYDKYLDYFEEPQKVIDIDTKRLLMSAMLNPEAQIDFLDFLETLSDKDRILLINSMSEDYSSDDLANIISPIILYEKNREIVKAVINNLIKSKSSLAYYPMTRFCEFSNDEELVRLAQKGLKELKIAGINEQSAKELYSQKFANSMLYSCYSSILDGAGNQGLLFSRIRSDNSIQLFCVVVNDINGIVDCFGFNSISNSEYSTILNKFGGDVQPFVITFEVGKLWLEEAEKISSNINSSLPYEYVCWKEILFDVNTYQYSSTDIIKGALNILPHKDCDLEQLFSEKILDKLFLTKTDSENFRKFINIVDEHISKTNFVDIKEIDEIIEDEIFNVFDEKTINIYKNRLLKIAFILMSNSNGSLASQLYELTMNKNILNEFFKEVLKKSIFVYYENEFKSRFDENADNIFLKRNKVEKSKIDDTKLRTLLENILENWGRDA